VRALSAESLGMRKFFFLFFLGAVSLCCGQVSENLKQISLHERHCMKVFFESMIAEDQGAHVLFFSQKPVCLTGPALKHCDHRFQDRLALKGWRAFKRHEHLFPHPNFIFSEELVESGRDFKVLNIYVMNRSSLVRCLREHQALFQSDLGENFRAEEFIARLDAGDALPALLNHNEALLGVLLGYGKESAKAFQKFTPKDARQPLVGDGYCRIAVAKPKRAKIQPIVFMGNPHSSEVQALSDLYKKELEEFIQNYPQRDLLEVVLQKLCEEIPSSSLRE
jgi:hypothetical protein